MTLSMIGIADNAYEQCIPNVVVFDKFTIIVDGLYLTKRNKYANM